MSMTALHSKSRQIFDATQRPIPPHTRIIPIHVSRVMSLPSARYSPSTVNKKASEFVMGTVRDNSGHEVSKSKALDRELHTSFSNE